GPAGVRVNAICPGWVDTDINRSYRKNEATVATVIDMVPLGRWAEAQDLVGAVTWLSSDAARYVTGAIIPVDGGLAVGLSRRWQRDMQLPPG
ncbi:MAG TPA: SDR family oxidoreductase, partial [Kofleriaceae bacterium]|nr:SDR family oxidoreductase [Kofleriaceae bacterium]